MPKIHACQLIDEFFHLADLRFQDHDAELDSIVRAERITPMVVDLPLVKRRCEELSREVEAARREAPKLSSAETAITHLIREAQARLNADP